MLLPCRAATAALFAAIIAGTCVAQEWTEAAVVERFLSQSPYAREAQARVAIARAEARGRTLYPNPSVTYTRESAGLTEFFTAEQLLPVSGRLGLLRSAGDAFVNAVEAESAFALWQARSDLRHAFYRVLTAQQREDIFKSSLAEIDRVISILRTREIEGEGSKFDRLRTERERGEVTAEIALLRASTALARAELLAFLPEQTQVPSLTGQVETAPLPGGVAELTQRALSVRDDYRAELRRVQQYRLEQRAAERLRIPEPVVTAGMKRADIGSRTIGYGPVVSVSVPLPVFNKGQAEVARLAAEQERAAARFNILALQISAAIQGAFEAYQVRAAARNEYLRELTEAGPELIRIAAVAYEEGETGILQLLDAYRLQRQAELRMLDIRAALKQAQIELERVVGEEFGK